MCLVTGPSIDDGLPIIEIEWRHRESIELLIAGDKLRLGRRILPIPNGIGDGEGNVGVSAVERLRDFLVGFVYDGG